MKPWAWPFLFLSNALISNVKAVSQVKTFIRTFAFILFYIYLVGYKKQHVNDDDDKVLLLIQVITNRQ